MKRLSRNYKIAIVLILLIVSNCITFMLTTTGIVTFGNRVVISADSEQSAQGIRKFAMLKKEIDTHYYKDVDETALIDSAIDGMFQALGDEYSQYYPKDVYQSMLETSLGSYAGIGLIITEDDAKNTLVVGTYPNTPAAGADFQPGDSITALDGENVEGIGSEAVAEKMRGSEGTQVTVTVRRGEEDLDKTVTREKITIPTVSGSVLDGQIGYIQISDFTESTAEDFNTTLDSLLTQNITGLIIDLRDNSGGIMTSAIEVADRLLGDTLIVYTENKQGERNEYRSSAEKQVDLPMAVLVNGNTASSSEILAGALQANDAARLVGTQTFGKGIIQEVVSLKDGSGYKLTDAAYYTPDGKSIHGTGLTPDVVVEAAQGDEDVQLEQARALIGLKN